MQRQGIIGALEPLNGAIREKFMLVVVFKDNFSIEYRFGKCLQTRGKNSKMGQSCGAFNVQLFMFSDRNLMRL